LTSVGEALEGEQKDQGWYLRGSAKNLKRGEGWGQSDGIIKRNQGERKIQRAVWRGDWRGMQEAGRTKGERMRATFGVSWVRRKANTSRGTRKKLNTREKDRDRERREKNGECHPSKNRETRSRRSRHKRKG